MNRPIDYIDKIVDLLALFEGVKIIDCEHNRARIDISFTIESFQSLYDLHYCAEGANVAFQTWTTSINKKETINQKPALGLLHNFHLSADDDDEPFEQLLILGIWFVWTLYAHKQIDKNKANRLLNLWHGAKVE